MSNLDINIEADFHTFRNQIITKFGEQFYEQTELFFQRAISQAEQGNLYGAIADGKFALELSNYSKDKSGLQYLIGFLSQVHCDLCQISKARAYYDLGLKILDTESVEYVEDLKMFDRLKDLIDGESWKEMEE